MAGFGLMNAGDIRNAVTSFGAAADSLFASKGHKIAAAGYRQAASMSAKNEEYIKESTAIKLMQAERNIYKVIGGQQADVAGAGFAASGTALDLLRDSAREGALTTELISTQGDIDLNNMQMQTLSYNIQADAADAAVKRSKLSGIINGIAGLVSSASGIPNIMGMFGGSSNGKPGG